MHSVTDGQTDGQQAYANSRSYCVAVRSATNCENTREDTPHKREMLQPHNTFNNIANSCRVIQQTDVHAIHKTLATKSKKMHSTTLRDVW